MKKILAVVMMGMLFTATCAFAEEAAKTEAAPAAAAVTKDACEPGKVPAKKKVKKHKKHKKAMANATTAVKK